MRVPMRRRIHACYMRRRIHAYVSGDLHKVYVSLD